VTARPPSKMPVTAPPKLLGMCKRANRTESHAGCQKTQTKGGSSSVPGVRGAHRQEKLPQIPFPSPAVERTI
jgi:hypothetical protein